MDALIGMKLRDVLDELNEGAPVKLGLKSGYYYCGPLPVNWESMITEEHRRDMRYINKELDSSENKMITFSQRWNERLAATIEEAMQQPGVPGEVEAEVTKAMMTIYNARLTAWDSLINRIANYTAELHKPGYLDRPVEAIYDSIDPDEEPGTICIVVDGLKQGKYYTSKEYREGAGMKYGRRKKEG
ncbi:MAG: hypothetical protein J6V25_11770 [Oscillospiraceae bacterium]|nr:hypothetical protein [Oscillospiraceae bacterium]